MIGFIIGLLVGVGGMGTASYFAIAHLWPYKERYERLSRAVDSKALDELVPPSDIEALERGDLPVPKLLNPTKLKKGKPAGDPYLDNLMEMTDFDRTQIEKKRLKTGLPPRDPLTGLGSFYIAEIEKEKIRQGW